MIERPIIILGGGGHASVVASMLRLLNAPILGYTDPAVQASSQAEIKYLGDDDVLESYVPDDVCLAIGIGSTRDASRRAQLFEKQRRAGFFFPSIVHPAAVVAPEATLGSATQVMAGAIVQPGVVLAKNVIVNTNASIDHNCCIGAHVHIAPGATLSGDVRIGSRAHIGTGASIIQGVKVGAHSVIGAGAVVIDNIPSETTAVGIPARPKKSNVS